LIGSVGLVGVTAMDVSVAAFSVNVAFTICAVAGIVNVHVALVLLGQMLLQPPNPEPEFGVSVSVTWLPAVTVVVHPAELPLMQVIPEPVTVPVPVPLVVTVSITPVVGVITVESVVLAVADPPPDTLTAFNCGEVASAATFTVTVIAGKLELGCNTFVVVQTFTEQVHPVPDIDATVNPAGAVSVTVTSPLVGPAVGPFTTTTL